MTTQFHGIMTWDEYVIEEYSLTDDLVRKWTAENRYMSPFT